jgi:hypothetical protein
VLLYTLIMSILGLIGAAWFLTVHRPADYWSYKNLNASSYVVVIGLLNLRTVLAICLSPTINRGGWWEWTNDWYTWSAVILYALIVALIYQRLGYFLWYRRHYHAQLVMALRVEPVGD